MASAASSFFLRPSSFSLVPTGSFPWSQSSRTFKTEACLLVRYFPVDVPWCFFQAWGRIIFVSSQKSKRKAWATNRCVALICVSTTINASEKGKSPISHAVLTNLVGSFRDEGSRDIRSRTWKFMRSPSHTHIPRFRVPGSIPTTAIRKRGAKDIGGKVGKHV